jgi:hypothetical protein
MGIVPAVFIGMFLSSVFGGEGPAFAVAIPAIAGIVALVIYLVKRARGRRTALGRAVTDQVIGFRKYLATAEADQLRFDEGEDIFSRYLPWAIVFGLADRWQRLCAQLVAAGRIPADPYWYSGPSYYASGYSVAALSDTVAARSTRRRPAAAEAAAVRPASAEDPPAAEAVVEAAAPGDAAVQRQTALPAVRGAVGSCEPSSPTCSRAR